MDKQELKNCPFCGSEKPIATDINGDGYEYADDRYHLRCSNNQCSCSILLSPLHCFREAESLVEGSEIWNTRPKEDKLNARIRELEEVHKAVNNWFYNTLMTREDICIPALILEEFDNILNKGN